MLQDLFKHSLLFIMFAVSMSLAQVVIFSGCIKSFMFKFTHVKNRIIFHHNGLPLNTLLQKIICFTSCVTPNEL